MLLQLKTQTLLQKGDFARPSSRRKSHCSLEFEEPDLFRRAHTRDLTYFPHPALVQEAVNT